ncbi:hypothetical protein VKT23_016252 [Stygiomarasmius scandens]|uniref:Uncharacterized protein n=1 Tax=Marasmiellus scandens TaxID=2682957 RepID=A0ABR1J034_9AGAR
MAAEAEKYSRELTALQNSNANLQNSLDNLQSSKKAEVEKLSSEIAELRSRLEDIQEMDKVIDSTQNPQAIEIEDLKAEKTQVEASLFLRKFHLFQ